ncbi:hypothetical protein J6590_082091 [Homalodisca vitripennis]|nr:hypothetical protein J6590_082091 [Homalodisca vitripennis]
MLQMETTCWILTSAWSTRFYPSRTPSTCGNERLTYREDAHLYFTYRLERHLKSDVHRLNFWNLVRTKKLKINCASFRRQELDYKIKYNLDEDLFSEHLDLTGERVRSDALLLRASCKGKSKVEDKGAGECEGQFECEVEDYGEYEGQCEREGDGEVGEG